MGGEKRREGEKIQHALSEWREKQKVLQIDDKKI